VLEVVVDVVVSDPEGLTEVGGGRRIHAEGTFRGSRELIAKLLGDLPVDERAALVGGTLGALLGFEAPVAA
jgi:hypothetical protein